jgi:hypothetical protein
MILAVPINPEHLRGLVLAIFETVMCVLCVLSQKIFPRLHQLLSSVEVASWMKQKMKMKKSIINLEDRSLFSNRIRNKNRARTNGRRKRRSVEGLTNRRGRSRRQRRRRMRTMRRGRRNLMLKLSASLFVTAIFFNLI